MVKNLNQAIGISYDGEYVYWTNILVESESIMKSKIDGSDITVSLDLNSVNLLDIVTIFKYFVLALNLSEKSHISTFFLDRRYSPLA